jgi:hypothetical protein
MTPSNGIPDHMANRDSLHRNGLLRLAFVITARVGDISSWAREPWTYMVNDVRTFARAAVAKGVSVREGKGSCLTRAGND